MTGPHRTTLQRSKQSSLLLHSRLQRPPLHGISHGDARRGRSWTLQLFHGIRTRTGGSIWTKQNKCHKRPACGRDCACNFPLKCCGGAELVVRKKYQIRPNINSLACIVCVHATASSALQPLFTGAQRCGKIAR